VHRRNTATGLYFWTTDHYIGVDNDPNTFFRPNKSSGSIYLNSLVYKELKAMAYIAKQLDFEERRNEYEKEAVKLKDAIQENCWDERDESFYSVDLNLLPGHADGWRLHSGNPRDYNCVIQRLDFWTNFLPLWAGIATTDQANAVLKQFNNKKTFNAPYGIRTLSKMEKMYNLKASGNPSNWQGPIWGISNYLIWKGLVNYGLNNEAKELAIKTIILFGKDLEKTGTMHEYYNPENGEPILHPGFQNWNYLVLNMIAWLEGREMISEF
jgi:putative isomerase